MRLQTTAGLLALALMAGACSRAPVTIPSTPAEGYSGGGFGADGAGGAGGAGGVGTSTLPGTQISDVVHFAVDQSTLDPQAIGILNAQVAWLSQNSAMPITIEGHADERGTRDYNFQLGASRASAVLNYMVSQGIPVGRIKTITFGRERPVATCSDESCYAQNRRAVTVVTGAGA